jgi:C4-type Zn-finger protein
VISFYAETIPFNPYRSIGRRCFVSYVEFLIDSTNGGYVKVDVYQDEEESPFIKDVLLKPVQDTTKAREWITLSVNNEANFHTFVMKQKSPSVQVRITSIRIHCEPGGLTSG